MCDDLLLRRRRVRAVQAARQFQITGWRIIDFPDPGLQMFSNFHTGSPAALANYSSPELDKMLEDARASGDEVKSPMVGSVYLQPEPGADPFVKVGDTVAAGQTLMIIEAMKTMNPIPAPKAGKIVEYLVADSQPVEFGEPLVVIG